VIAGATAAPFPIQAQAVTYRCLDPSLQMGLALVYRENDTDAALRNLVEVARHAALSRSGGSARARVG
jgi:hypothetical protein